MFAHVCNNRASSTLSLLVFIALATVPTFFLGLPCFGWLFGGTVAKAMKMSKDNVELALLKIEWKLKPSLSKIIADALGPI